MIRVRQRGADQGVVDAVGTYFYYAIPGQSTLELYQNRE